MLLFKRNIFNPLYVFVFLCIFPTHALATPPLPPQKKINEGVSQNARGFNPPAFYYRISLVNNPFDTP